MRGVSRCAKRNHAPILSPDCFLLWRLAAREQARRRELERLRCWYANLSAQEKTKYLSVRRTPERRERNRLATTKYRAANHEKLKAHIAGQKRDRLRSDPAFYLAVMARNRIYDALKRARISKSDRSKRLVGCSWAELRTHIQSKFLKGMTWSNMGKVWHIDHIVPVSNFDLTTQDQQRLCFHYTNLQPLWGQENRSKGNRFKGTHQFPLLLD